MNPVLLYITAANREEAIFIATALLQKKLVACANILDHATSLYWWQGAVEQAQESVITAKTFDYYTTRIIREVKEIHSYSCPAIVTLPLNGGSPDYIHWMREQLVPREI